MKKLVLLVFLSLLLGNVHAADRQQLERNKEAAVNFYNKALNDKDAEAAIAMMGDEYIQHNAGIEDGKEGFRKFIAGFKERYPNSHSRIVRVIAENDLVVLHVHMVREPGSRGEAVMDIFRLDDQGRLVEHWDVLQAIPENIPHDNTMF